VQISTHSGHRYGALFLMDNKPHRFAPEKYALLAHFAELVTRELEKDVVSGCIADAQRAGA